MSLRGWIGVDFDGTLAEYNGWQGIQHAGEPIKPMVERVKGWLAEGKDVKIFTARVYSDGTPARNAEVFKATRVIHEWCEKHIGQKLPVTCVKDFGMVALYDDRCVQVELNTGRLIEASC